MRSLSLSKLSLWISVVLLGLGSIASIAQSNGCVELLQAVPDREFNPSNPGSSNAASPAVPDSILTSGLSAYAQREGLDLNVGTNSQVPAIRDFLSRMREGGGIAASASTAFDADLNDVEGAFNGNFGTFLILRKNGEIIATAALYRQSHNIASLRKIYVEGSFRQKGLTRELVQTLVEYSKSLGYSAVEYDIRSDTTQTTKIYNSLGFRKAESPTDRPDVLEVLRLELEASPAAERLGDQGAKRAFFNKVADILETHSDQVAKALSRVNTRGGVDYELRQAIDTLRNAEHLELQNLTNVRRLDNVAVYASTNIPLYTLILHGFIPLTVSNSVWFRTPQSTRQVYVDVFKIIADALPPGAVNGLNILTENSDVQYDKFRTKYVLGLNPKGKRFVRKPSEIVVFTGNPATGREILLRNLEKLDEIAETDDEFKQVFLGFGAGINPVVVTASARLRMNQAVSSVVDSVRINSGQDCIAPNFYLIHSALATDFVSALRNQTSALRVGVVGDLSADYSPLTLSSDLGRLIAYKEKYARFLVNADEAEIDSGKMIVTPHIFVFPMEMFKDVALDEHYAPFISIFTYSSASDLEAVARDSRVQRKAMYATVFGSDAATEEVDQAVMVFRQNRHAVNVNSSVYADESGNMAFGGLGEDTTIIGQLKKEKGAPVQQSMSHGAILFSEQAARFFSYGRQVVLGPMPKEYFSEALRKLLQEANAPPSHTPALLNGWENLRQPQTTLRPTGLAYLRETIAKEGAFQVLPGERPPPETVSTLEEFFGTRLVFMNERDSQAAPFSVPGLALSFSDATEGPSKLNACRGSLNPFLGWQMLGPMLDGNKLRETTLSEAISPGLMAPTWTFKYLQDQGIIPESLRQRIIDLTIKLNESLQSIKVLDSATREVLLRDLTDLLTELFARVRERVPQGAYFKGYNDFATADLGIQVTSFNSNPRHLASEYLRRFERTKLAFQPHGNILDTDFQAELLSNYAESGTKFINALLKRPDDILIQQRVQFAKTELGINREYRVDFLDGEAVFSKLRFSREYYPEEALEAKRVINEFFAKTPPEFRHLSGGADVAKLEDGRWIVVEFNFGSSSGTWSPSIFPIDANKALSNLLQTPTPLIRKLTDVFNAGPEAQRQMLQSLRNEREKWHKNSLDDLSVVELAHFFRDEYMQQWRNDPTPDRGQQIIATLENLFQGLASEGNEDLSNLVAGAKGYIIRPKP